MEDFQDYLAELGISDRVILTGYVSDNELIWLYRNCYANLYPSLFEGFGLPVLEGMQFGAPTLSSNSTSMPEVAGDAATMLNPHDQHAWTQAMLELASDRDRRGRMGLAASARALTFDWNRSATAMLAIYEEATHSPKRAHLNQKGDDKNGIARAENVG
jgi:glycosyltransferase involved in cell wall biosynthesis